MQILYNYFIQRQILNAIEIIIHIAISSDKRLKRNHDKNKRSKIKSKHDISERSKVLGFASELEVRI